MIIKELSLTPHVLQVIRHGATERPYTGLYNECFREGTYLCRACGAALFRSHAKFGSSCGWPSFDEALLQAVEEKPDADGYRTEIICTRCSAHLGHVFDGEGFSVKNRRFCVNSLSLDFVESSTVMDTEEALLAGGCFWGIEYLLRQQNGVLLTETGYMGGIKTYPSYHDVCTGKTKHYEAVRVLYDPSIIDYKSLLMFFFEIHDPSQINGQGPDIGSQYQSAVFYYNEMQQFIAEQLIELLKQTIHVATKLLPVHPFWPAEEEHQHYYSKTGKEPYCHTYIKRFQS